jgi:hypothetical protein
MEKIQIEYGFAKFEITIGAIHYTEPVEPQYADCDEKGGYEIDFTAICLLDDEEVTNERTLAALHEEIIKKIVSDMDYE